MKVTGYALREAIKQQELRRDTAAKAFTGSLKVFPGEEEGHETPEKVVEQFLAAEKAVAQLQVAQARYNLQVMVNVPVLGGAMTLSEAVKRIGGLGRTEKMWRSTLAPKRESYGYDEDTRDPDKIRAKATITPAKSVEYASQAAKKAGALRAAIATANAQEVEIDLDPALFE